MRISDWSSDVCSSDLAKTRQRSSRRDGHRARERPAFHHICGLDTPSAQDRPGSRRQASRSDRAHAARWLRAPLRSEERRVGKECVRVDLGGRRIIKKKKNKIYFMQEQQHEKNIEATIRH